MSKTTFQQFSEGRENNFDFLRMLFAALVIYAHSYAFLYNGMLAGYDPLVRLSRGQVGLGGLAVEGFFLISGFLVTKSWLRSKGAWDYIKKRSLRILPGLLGVLLFCTLVIGPMATSLRLPDYFFQPQTWLYVGFMFFPKIHYHDRLPGVFAQNPVPYLVNHSLWTIRFEAICYVFVAILGLVSLYHKPRSVLAIGISVYLLNVLPFALHRSFGDVGVFLQLLTYFLVGMLFLLYQDVIPYSRGLFLVSMLVLIVATAGGFLNLVRPLLVAYVLFYIAFYKGIKLQHFARRGDLSYGVYLYACPIQQMLVLYFQPLLNPTVLFICALALTSGMAMLSWCYIEKPFLNLKSRPARETISPKAVVSLNADEKIDGQASERPAYIDMPTDVAG